MEAEQSDLRFHLSCQSGEAHCSLSLKWIERRRCIGCSLLNPTQRTKPTRKVKFLLSTSDLNSYLPTVLQNGPSLTVSGERSWALGKVLYRPYLKPRTAHRFYADSTSLCSSLMGVSKIPSFMPRLEDCWVFNNHLSCLSVLTDESGDNNTHPPFTTVS